MEENTEKTYLSSRYDTLDKITEAGEERLKKEVAEGDAEAMNALGMLRESEEKLEAAGRWYMLAGFAGSAEGVYNYGKKLFWGWTGKPDYRTAQRVFRIARARGYKKGACYFLAVYEEKGIFGAPDPEKAIEYYTEGAEDGDFRCYRELGRIYAEGEITEEDPEKAYYNFMMAGAIGDPISVTNMAMFLEEGYGCEKNMARAVELYRMAAEAGEENAIEALERLGMPIEKTAE
ncbi:MAG: tetratricopeptide repeat protein [Anaerovoracaceae bacterium]|nr:tetratricopeptide repeat protein [Bacillota bacterium]MDY2671108.1 tetratricopeptide repeat protein [Anaerovoracaceae bacterium]